MRHGDSTGDRLARARTLARVAPDDPELMLAIGRAALEAHELEAARAAIAPLIGSDSPHGRPTRRVCLLMADIEEAEGRHGAVREWLSRAARAPRDKAWVADGVISDRWAPVSPTGTLDAFVWRAPDERLAALAEPEPIEPQSAAPLAPPPALSSVVAANGSAAEAPLSAAAAVQPLDKAPPDQTAPASPPEPLPTAASPAPPEPPHAASGPTPRVGVIIDPTSMAPDDPGPGEPGETEAPRRRKSWIYASD